MSCYNSYLFKFFQFFEFPFLLKHDGENILAYLDFSGNDDDNLSKLILVNKVLNGLNTMILNNKERLIK